MTNQEVFDRVLRRFGHPTIAVELETEHLEEALHSALEEWNRFMPNTKIQSVYAYKPVTVVEFYREPLAPDPPETWAQGVLDVQFVRDSTTSEGIDIEVAMLQNPWTFIAQGFPATDIVDYELKRQWIEVLQWSFGNLPDFAILPEEKKLFLHTPMNMKVTITWAWPVLSAEEIPLSMEDLFVDLVTAHARLILGHIRNKFQGVPGAGTVVQLDGQYHLNKAETDLNNLKQTLILSSPWYMGTRGA